MKSARINQWAQPVQVEDLPQPVPNSDEVLVKVHAASINPIDKFVVAGNLQQMLTVPHTPGTDFAGEVVSVGAEVTHVKAGDAVYGLIPMRGGTFAEYVSPKATEVALKPQSLDYTQAAAAPLSALAAWQSMFDLAQLQSGERVLILGAGGSVGSFAVQLAKDKGAYVIASDVGSKADFLKTLGADEILDAQGQPFEEVVQPVDVVLNFVKAELQAAAYKVLKSGGRYATTGPQPDQEEAEKLGIRSYGVFTQPSAKHLTDLAEVIDAGKVKVFVGSTYSLDDVQAAFESQPTGKTSDKVVLTVP